MGRPSRTLGQGASRTSRLVWHGHRRKQRRDESSPTTAAAGRGVRQAASGAWQTRHNTHSSDLCKGCFPDLRVDEDRPVPEFMVPPGHWRSESTQRLIPPARTASAALNEPCVGQPHTLSIDADEVSNQHQETVLHDSLCGSGVIGESGHRTWGAAQLDTGVRTSFTTISTWPLPPKVSLNNVTCTSA